MSTTTKSFNWGSFLMGILFILTAMVSFKNPVANLVAIAYVFAFSAIVKGIFDLTFKRKAVVLSGNSATGIIVIGILDILIGVFLLFNMSFSMVALPFIFAFWFIIDSIMGLMTAIAFKEVTKEISWISIILNVLGIILGISLLFNPVTAALTLSFLVGAYFLINGINFIIFSF